MGVLVSGLLSVSKCIALQYEEYFNTYRGQLFLCLPDISTPTPPPTPGRGKNVRSVKIRSRLVDLMFGQAMLGHVSVKSIHIMSSQIRFYTGRVMSDHVRQQQSYIRYCLVGSGSDKVRSCRAILVHVRQCEVRSGQLWMDQIISYHVRSCRVMSGRVRPDQARYSNVRSCQMMPCQVRSL